MYKKKAVYKVKDKYMEIYNKFVKEESCMIEGYLVEYQHLYESNFKAANRLKKQGQDRKYWQHFIDLASKYADYVVVLNDILDERVHEIKERKEKRKETKKRLRNVMKDGGLEEEYVALIEDWDDIV